jgi:hypothetical protein
VSKMPKIKMNEDFKDYRVSIVNGDVIETFKVVDIYQNTLEHEAGVLPLSDGVKYYDLSHGGIHFLYNVDLPAKVESENLKLLRRSTALKNIFAYDRNKKFDLIGLMPWLIIILLVLFK